MYTSIRRVAFAAFIFSLPCAGVPSLGAPYLWAAQSSGSSGSIAGTVADSTGAVIPGATITILNPVSGYTRSAVSDSAGHYQFVNVPFNPYHLTVSVAGFNAYASDVQLHSSVPVSVTNTLSIGASSTVIEVDANDLMHNDSTVETQVDRSAFEKLPLESQSSGLSALVTATTPGIAADSNGQLHGLGDHASNTFAVDGQQISDQQSKTFSNQLPSNSVQSISVIEGAPPAEYGGKTSLIIQVTTRSGLGANKPTGSISTSYGTFGSSTGSVDLSYGGAKWGNFVELDGLNTGRFLDPAEFAVFHDKGNELNFFDRIDRQITDKDSVHLNVNVSRSWFQNPNSYDNLNVQNVLSGGTGATPIIGSVGDTDQRSKIVTFNIAPTYTRVTGANSVFNLGAFVRRDAYNYYPSSNPLADLDPIQNESISQARNLTNAGAHTDFTYVRGVNNIKIGALYQHTFLNESDSLGIVNATFNSPCLDENNIPLSGYNTTEDCPAGNANVATNLNATSPFNPVLLPYDLTRGGSMFNYTGHADIKELALYVEDQIKAGDWVFNVGIRGDLYNGLTKASQAEPRLGAAYTLKRTNTVLRASYARTLESPFNENLVLSSQGCENAVLSPLLLCSSGVAGTLQPGFRNEFHAGLQQAFGKSLVISGDYIWKYTHNAFDFSTLGNTPITFPIDWHNAKVPGFAIRADVPNFHHVSAFVVMSSVAARFFPPQVAGAGATVGHTGLPFRIDHDERFNQTTHLQYQSPLKFKNTALPWVGMSWHFDSGLTAGSVPCFNPTGANSPCGGTVIDGQNYINLGSLSADEQFQAGLVCNGVKATPTAALPALCLANQLTSQLVKIPAANTENDDSNPPRIAPRNLFDASLGQDNLFNGDRYKWSARLTAVNVTNKYALYNFLSTFSGTHYVTPRTLTAEVDFHF